MQAQRHRLQVLIFSGVAIAVTVVLAAGLSGIRLQPGKSFPVAAFSRPGEGAVELSFLGRLFIVLLRVLLFAVWIILPLAVLYLIVSPSARKRLLRDLLGLLPFFVLLYLLLRASSRTLQGEEQQLQMPEVAPQISPLTSGPVLTNTSPPEWFIFAASLVVAILVIAPLVGVAWFLWQRRRRREVGLERLAQEAQATITAIQSGADLRNAIIHCYVEMARIVREQRGIARDSTETATEFAAELEGAGLPGQDVRRLTRLFESVRYGAKLTGEDEEREAVAALTAIAQACRGVR